MKLILMTPEQQPFHHEVVKVIAEAPNGVFCLLPQHVDFVTSLVPGILIFEAADGHETFLAVDEGVLVKCGADVRVAVNNAVEDTELARLKKTVDKQFQQMDEQEKRTLTAVSRIEAGFVRRFLEIQHYGQ